jgi:hypothetical protein
LGDQVVANDPQKRTRNQLLCERMYAGALRPDRDAHQWAKLVLDYGVGRPVPLTDMPAIQINTQVVQQQASFDELTDSIKVLVQANILSPDLFAKFAERGNGYGGNGYEDEEE